MLTAITLLAGIRAGSAQLYSVSAPYFYMASENAQTCQAVCTNGGVTNMTNFFFSGFYDSKPTSLCALSIDGRWIPGSQAADQTDCSIGVQDSSATSDGMACACINTNNSPGLAAPAGYNTCSDACYNSPYGQGASLPASGSDNTNSYACVASNNVGISNAFGNVVLDQASGNATCVTASRNGGSAEQSYLFSCACVFPTTFRRKLQLHRKDLGQVAAA